MDENKVTKEYVVNESVLVIHDTLDALYQNFYSNIPKDVEKKVVDLIDYLKEKIEHNNDMKDWDITYSKYFERVVYEDNRNK